MEENKLIEQAVRGDTEAFCELYGIYKDRLFRYAFYKLKDPALAEDAVSECILSAWKGIGGLRSAKSFPAWLFRILSSQCARQIQALIAEREKQELYSERVRSVLPDPSLALELSEALNRLSEEEREMVLLSAVAGLKSKEIASMYGMTAGSVRSKLSRSLSKMRNYLEMQQ